jgi:hypothetical protein
MHEFGELIRDRHGKLNKPPWVENILNACEFVLHTCSVNSVLLDVLRGSLGK